MGASWSTVRPIFHAVGNHGLLDEHLFSRRNAPVAPRPDRARPGGLARAAGAQDARLAGQCAPAADRSGRSAPESSRSTHPSGSTFATWGIMFYDLTYPLRYDSTHRLAMKQVFGHAYRSDSCRRRTRFRRSGRTSVSPNRSARRRRSRSGVMNSCVSTLTPSPGPATPAPPARAQSS